MNKQNSSNKRTTAKVEIYDLKGKKVGTSQLPKEIFGVKINQRLIAQAVKVYLVNQSRARAKTKTRGEVRGSTIKIYRQKGTGRARHGDRYAPIFVGGGVAHGPKGRIKRRRMPRKMKRQALFSALTSKLKEKMIVVVRGLEKIEPKTKAMTKIMANLKCQMKNGKLEENVLLVSPQKNERLLLASRNIAGLKLKQVAFLNTYEVLNNGKIILMEPGIKKLKEVFLS